MVDNHGGTSGEDNIAAWITDGKNTPTVHAVVNFMPFSGVPLPTERKSLGGVKSLYR